MDPKVNYFAVGLFVVILSVAMIFFTLWMAFGLNKQVYDNYMIYVSESVSGLSIEAPVKFNGVNVGSVIKIQLVPSNPHQVAVEVAVQEGTPVSVDTRATMMSQGITGLTFINLQGGDIHSAPLRKLPGQDLPVIRSAPSLMVRLDTTLEALSTSLSELDQRVSYLLRQENQDNITLLLRSLAQVSATMAKHQQALGLTMDNLPIALTNLSNVTSSAAQAYSDLNGQLNQGLLGGLNNLLGELQSNPSMLIRGRTLPPLGPGEQG